SDGQTVRPDDLPHAARALEGGRRVRRLEETHLRARFLTGGTGERSHGRGGNGADPGSPDGGVLAGRDPADARNRPAAPTGVDQADRLQETADRLLGFRGPDRTDE